MCYAVARSQNIIANYVNKYKKSVCYSISAFDPIECFYVVWLPFSLAFYIQARCYLISSHRFERTHRHIVFMCKMRLGQAFAGLKHLHSETRQLLRQNERFSLYANDVMCGRLAHTNVILCDKPKEYIAIIELFQREYRTKTGEKSINPERSFSNLLIARSSTYVLLEFSYKPKKYPMTRTLWILKLYSSFFLLVHKLFA